MTSNPNPNLFLRQNSVFQFYEFLWSVIMLVILEVALSPASFWVRTLYFEHGDERVFRLWVLEVVVEEAEAEQFLVHVHEVVVGVEVF
jgi:hypothetical protein